MGKKQHVRVVINGMPLYNLGGKTCKQLKCQADCKDWEPLTKTEWPLTLGTGRFRSEDIKYITLIVITRTPGHKRRIDHVYQYVYNDGIIDRFHAVLHQFNRNKKFQPLYCAPNSLMYKSMLNYTDLSVQHGKDIMWRGKQKAEALLPPKQPSLWDRFVAWIRSWFG